MLLLLSMDEVIETPKGVVSKGSDEALISQTIVRDANPVPQITNDVSEFIRHSEAPVPHIPEVGLSASGDSTPVKTENEIPYTEKEAEEILKNGSKTSLNLHEMQEGEYVVKSKPFLAMLVEKFYQKLGSFGKLAGNRT